LNILVVDDEIEYIMAMEIILESEGYDVSTATSGEEAVKLLRTQNFDAILTDLIMGGMDGMDLLKIVKDDYPQTEVIIVTGYGTVQNAVQAMKEGAYTYFVKSHDPDELKMEVAKLKMLKSIKKDQPVDDTAPSMDSFLLQTKSPKFKKALNLAQKSAQSNANILILGESGVGKEVFARYIHECSKRHKKPFIAVNCHAFSENLLESELFGHEKGSFTGASERRKGRFEAANEGTLMLDELGDISLSTQVKLLRTLENKCIERIGGNKSIEIDFRLLCATNKDLKKAIEKGEFREDLFYRISTIAIEIPPLRNRKEDLPELIRFFFEKSSTDLDCVVERIEDGVMESLINYDYPGNVRELKNIIERLVVLSEDGVIRKKHIFDNKGMAEKLESINDIRPLKDVRKEMESEYIAEALARCDQNVTTTAKKLGISRRQLFNKINEYNLR